MVPSFKHVSIVFATASLIGVAAPARMAIAATPDELIAKCDALASDPEDSNRYAAPVKDDAFAPGAAIDACKAAVDANPTSARSHYQLGRAYHLADRDKEAFRKYIASAQLGYAPALKAIGDAYASGRGLPSGEVQSFHTAIDWFHKALDAGDRYAQVAIDDASKRITEGTFDKIIFQDPEYMDALYTGEFPRSYENDFPFNSYLMGVAHELMGDTMFFIDQDCQHYIYSFNLKSIGLRIMKKGMDHMDKHPFDFSIIAGTGPENKMGENDARTLMHRYSCKSPIVEKIAANVRLASGPPVTQDNLRDNLPNIMKDFAPFFQGQTNKR